MIPTDDFSLTISRLLQAPRRLLWKAWSDPVHLAKWWCPEPWTTEVLEFDLRPGGGFHTLMRGPDGETSDNPGSFLDVQPQSRIVFTSLLLADWRPAAPPWMPMTAYIDFSDEAGGTRYTARVLHADGKGRDAHEQMGFHDGWGTCIEQLDHYARKLS